MNKDEDGQITYISYTIRYRDIQIETFKLGLGDLI
jgi:hypothetical protein